MADITVYPADTITCGGEKINGAELRALLTRRIHNPEGDFVRINGVVHSVPATKKALELYDVLRSVSCDHSVKHAQNSDRHVRGGIT